MGVRRLQACRATTSCATRAAVATSTSQCTCAGARQPMSLWLRSRLPTCSSTCSRLFRVPLASLRVAHWLSMPLLKPTSTCTAVGGPLAARRLERRARDATAYLPHTERRAARRARRWSGALCEEGHGRLRGLVASGAARGVCIEAYQWRRGQIMKEVVMMNAARERGS